MKVVIIDDQPAAIKSLSSKLQKYPELTIAGEAENGTQGISLIKTVHPDLLFLDIELPDISGIEFLNRMDVITKKRCCVVIYTAHPSYMLPAFRGKAFDFLLKPIEDSELQKIVQRFLIEYQETGNSMTTSTQKEREKLLLYVNASDFSVVNINDVAIFQYNHDQRCWEVFTAGRQTPIRLKRSTNNDMLLNMDERFIQVSQRHIININYLMEVRDGVCHLFPPFQDFDDIKIGRSFRKKLTERFCAL